MKMLKQAFIFFINIIYPQLCLLCGKLCKKYLCKQCKTRICKNATFKIETINSLLSINTNLTQDFIIYSKDY